MTRRIGKPDTETDVKLRRRLDGSGKRHFIMVAGAGSGKTTSLVKALGYIKQSQGNNLRRNGQKIACITFTEVAVEEIFGDVGNDPLFHVSTIHSFLWSVVKPFQNDIRQWVYTRLNQQIEEAQEKIAAPRTRQTTKDQARENIRDYQSSLVRIGGVKNFRYGTGSDYSNGVLGHSDILSIGSEFIIARPLMRSMLVRRFPVIFVDESQDTNPEVIDALRVVAREIQQGFCLGFFGDPVQKIYMQGAGAIPVEDGWEILQKPENFRCSQAVLRVINRIRAEDDGLVQVRGRHEIQNGVATPVEGTARILILPSDERRQERLQEARSWLAEQDTNGGWLEEGDESSFRMLVLVHRIAASKLGFPNLYSALNDHSPENLKSGLVDGTAWVVRPFLLYILPLAHARTEGREFEIMRLLRKYCPKLQSDTLTPNNTVETLNQLQSDVAALVAMLEPSNSVRIGDIATFIRDKQLFAFEQRYLDLVEYFRDAAPVINPMPNNADLRFMQCESEELWGYRRYIEKLSPFATQQGIKGAEFEKVLVIVDDQEGTLPGFSYGKYFGVIPLSDRDENNIAEGKDSVVDRTRRLFYVCCSRALSDLAVIIFAENTSQMRNAIEKKGFFEETHIFVLD